MSGRVRKFPTPPLRQGIATSSRPRSQGLLTKVIGAATLSWFADILGATLGAEGAFSSLITLLQMLVAVAILSTLSSLPLSFLLSLLVVFAYKQGAPVRHIAIGAGLAKFVTYSGYFMFFEQPSPPALRYLGTLGVAAATAAGLLLVLGQHRSPSNS